MALALAAYRHLLRATRIAFQGDLPLLHAARTQARAGFDKQTSLDPSSKEANEAISHAEDVARVLRHNIVQGAVGEGENEPIKLRIHKDIERGDNDSVKNPLVSGDTIKIGGGCKQ